MAIVYIGREADPNYVALSTDIVGGDTIDGAQPGMKIFTYDDASWYIVDSEMKIQEYVLPVSVTVAGDIEIGAIEIKDATADTRASVGANGLHVDVRTSALPTGAATSAKQDDAITELRGINLLSSVVFDTYLISYTDITKTVISKVEWKLGANVVYTLTLTAGATGDTWVKT